jgi:group I intron endonuclease
MIISGIYIIRSIIKPERIYIGSAVNFKKRKILHLHLLRKNRHANKKLQNHYNKYGEEDIIFSILAGYDRDQLINAEQYFIDLYKPYFNLCQKAGSTIGRKMSEESKQKLSERKKGIKRPPFSNEWKRNLSKAAKTRPPVTKETRIKLKIKNTGINNPQFGKKISEEHKQIIRESNVRNKTGKHYQKIKLEKYNQYDTLI